MVRHLPGAGAAGARPEKLAALFREPRAVTAVGQTNSWSGKAQKTTGNKHIAPDWQHEV